MSVIASQITSLMIVFSTVYLDTDQRKHQSSASLAFVRGIHRRAVNSLHKWPVTWKMSPFDDVIIISAVCMFTSLITWCAEMQLMGKYYRQENDSHLSLNPWNQLIWFNKSRRNQVLYYSTSQFSNECIAEQITVRIVQIMIQATDLAQILYGVNISEKTRATQNFNMAAIYRDGRHWVSWNVIFLP